MAKLNDVTAVSGNITDARVIMPAFFHLMPQQASAILGIYTTLDGNTVHTSDGSSSPTFNDLDPFEA